MIEFFLGCIVLGIFWRIMISPVGLIVVVGVGLLLLNVWIGG
jgi:hypothetical protein